MRLVRRSCHKTEEFTVSPATLSCCVVLCSLSLGSSPGTRTNTKQKKPKAVFLVQLIRFMCLFFHVFLTEAVHTRSRGHVMKHPIQSGRSFFSNFYLDRSLKKLHSFNFFFHVLVPPIKAHLRFCFFSKQTYFMFKIHFFQEEPPPASARHTTRPKTSAKHLNAAVRPV